MFAVITNLFGNVIGFVPYGFILPVIAHKCRRGTFIITGNNLKEMDFMSLSNEQIDKYMEMFDLEREEDLEL